MAQQIMIIGLGQFGMSLARALTEKGAEVLAIDEKKNLVDEAATFVAEAIVLNATNEQDLARLEPGKRDCVVCAIGDEAIESSIICTALLRQMGAPLIIARATDKIHQRILSLVGAHQIINPEQEFGKRFANRLLFRDLIVDTSIGDDLHLTEMHIQPSMVGKTLVDLALPKKYGVVVAGIRRNSTGRIITPSPNQPLNADDNLVIVSNENSILEMIKGMEE